MISTVWLFVNFGDFDGKGVMWWLLGWRRPVGLPVFHEIRLRRGGACCGQLDVGGCELKCSRLVEVEREGALGNFLFGREEACEWLCHKGLNWAAWWRSAGWWMTLEQLVALVPPILEIYDVDTVPFPQDRMIASCWHSS